MTEDHWTAEHSTAERGSGSILALAILAGLLGLVVALLPLVGVLEARQRLAGAADAAALAAAEVAVGILPGIPCTQAAHVAEANGAVLAACTVDGAVVSVAATETVFGFTVRVAATAGPPGTTAD